MREGILLVYSCNPHTRGTVPATGVVLIKYDTNECKYPGRRSERKEPRIYSLLPLNLLLMPQLISQYPLSLNQPIPQARNKSPGNSQFSCLFCYLLM